MAPLSNRDLAKHLIVETAFLDYCRLSAITDADIDQLYEQVAKLNRLDHDEDMETVIAYDLESVHSKDDLRARIKEMRHQTAQKIFDYYNLSDENAGIVRNTMTGIGIPKDTAQKLTTAIAERTLDQPFDQKKSMADKLYDMLQGKQKLLKERLATDYETYRQTKVPNPVIQDIEPGINEHLSGMTREQAMEYETKKEDYDFRQKLRADFSRPEGIRPAFLKLYGTMMENGKNQAQKPNSASNFDAFRKQMEQMFGENAPQEIDRALGINAAEKAPDALRQEREKQYVVKCQEIYFKTMAGILSHKAEFDRNSGNNVSDYQIYVQTIERDFIRGLCNGQTNLNCLAFVEPDNTVAKSKKEELALRKKYKDETAENQIVSVHHKLPLGAARDIFRKIFGKTDERAELAGASALVNNLGNMSLIIGKRTHQELEANGNYVVTANSDNMIFAARVNKEFLTSESLRIPSYLKEGIRKYALPSGKDNIVKVNMNFSEAQEIAKQRQKLKAPSVATNIIGKFRQFWKTAIAK